MYNAKNINFVDKKADEFDPFLAEVYEWQAEAEKQFVLGSAYAMSFIDTDFAYEIADLVEERGVKMETNDKLNEIFETCEEWQKNMNHIFLNGIIIQKILMNIGRMK